MSIHFKLVTRQERKIFKNGNAFAVKNSEDISPVSWLYQEVREDLFKKKKKPIHTSDTIPYPMQNKLES